MGSREAIKKVHTKEKFVKMVELVGGRVNVVSVVDEINRTTPMA